MLPDYVKVYDKWGNERTHEELLLVYGAISVTPCNEQGLAWRVAMLRERADVGEGFSPVTEFDKDEPKPLSSHIFAPTALVVSCYNADGAPVENVLVAFTWPDADPRPGTGCGKDRAVVGPTNENGDVGFAMGPGAYYLPPSGGPHGVWIDQLASNYPTDCTFGLGMLVDTNHAHMDVVYVLKEEEPPTEPDIEGALEDMAAAKVKMRQARVLMRESIVLIDSAMDRLLGNTST